jgi:tRNA (guanine37-N1)-methyltransferase
MRIDFVTLFPEMVLDAVSHSILARAAGLGMVRFGAANPRDFAYDAHRTVDDSPYGGGAGMVLRPEPTARAIEWLIGVQGSGFRVQGARPSAALKSETPDPKPHTPDPSQTLDLASEIPSHLTPHPSPCPPPEGAPASLAIVLTDPTGDVFTQATASELAQRDQVVFVCGRYEGIDDRIRSLYATHVCSIGDFIVTGGELPALLMSDAVVRLIPGVLGSSDSLRQDSHGDGLLSAPQFTRPDVFLGIEVPQVLREGNHREAARWRRTVSLKTTRDKRPDLFCKAPIAKSDLDLLSF